MVSGRGSPEGRGSDVEVFAEVAVMVGMFGALVFNMMFGEHGPAEF